MKKQLINLEPIKEQIKAKLIEKYNTTTFINIGRHEEKQKKLSRIIEAAKLLKEKTDRKFRILFIGDGEDTKKYKEVVNK